MYANNSEIRSPYLCDPKTTACFSGHRPEKLPINLNSQTHAEAYRSYIYLHIHEAYLKGYRTFITGMARGFDILAATAVINYRHRFNVTEKINLIGVSPFSEEVNRLNCHDRFNYNFVKDNCDEMIYLNREYAPWCYSQRNRFMVDHSSLVICSCIEEKSGTGQTVKYARKKGLEIDNISVKDILSIPENDYPIPADGYWIFGQEKVGTVTRITSAHPFLPVNDTSDNEKKQ